MYKRKKTKVVSIGKIKIGGNYPIAIQSMCNTKTSDVKSTIKQIKELEEEGCEIIRVAVPDLKSAKALAKIKKAINIPLVADIHFDYNLALEAIKQGVDKIRINPGNIGSKERIEKVVALCKKNKIPIRVGINSGSIEQSLLNKYGVSPKAAVLSAIKNIKILERNKFFDIVVSIKMTSVPKTITAYQMLSKKINYPLHLGITEAGLTWSGSIKSAVGIGSLLSQGIGDTIRVSLTDNPVNEVRAAWEILKSLELRQRGREIISCPTCGRTQIDLILLANKVEKATRHIKKPIKIAVMGCPVNGPGEAREADVGVAGGKNMGVIFRKGKIIKIVPENKILEALLKEIEKI